MAPSPAAADELLRLSAVASGAAFGWHRATVGRLAASLVAADLARDDLAPVGRLACTAVVARVVETLATDGRLGRYAGVASGPTFARAATATLEELRLAGHGSFPDAAVLATTDSGLAALDPGLAALSEAYGEALRQAGLIDRAAVLQRAAARAGDPAFQHPLLDLPTLVVDVPLLNEAEAAFVSAVAARSPELLATTPSGDERSLSVWVDRVGVAPGPEASGAASRAADSSLTRLQQHLFEDHTSRGDGEADAARAPKALDDAVLVLSAPGESRECVEIARRLQAQARAGVPFDRMAIFLRSVAEYRPHLEEALQRAGIPAWFSRGATRPDPAGRAFLALLACRTENLSARRFAEYLSLGEVPQADTAGAPPAATPSGDRWVAPDEELVPAVVATALDDSLYGGATGDTDESAEPVEPLDPEQRAVADGGLRVPRHWEQLLVEAAVIGGRDRWERRLEGLAQQYRLDIEEIDDPDDPASLLRAGNLEALSRLRDFALPILDELADLPDRAIWGEWIDALSKLATRTLRRPDRVLAVLSELAPMASVGPVQLGDVQRVLGERMLELAVPPPASRHGCVFVAPAEAARGLCFDVVCVPGLAERLFPRKISEEPLLLDGKRHILGGLATNEDRVVQERMALRLAAGAARELLVLSYPRLDLDQSRPRVPSFYALEALRAAEGALPGFDELAARAESVAGARVGWPAPERPADAIDEAEHDLALLDRLLAQSEEESVGTARYLLTANPHLGRALRFRARRWLTTWTPADGLLTTASGEVAAGAREAMVSQRLSARSYSATALQNFAKCPYKFFLQAVHRLEPRDEPEAIDEIDPLQRGSLVHDAQYQLHTRLDDAGALPVTREGLAEARAILDEVLDDVADRYRDDLAPAIDRVWLDGIASVRADLREWLRRESEDESGFVPWRFELSFGLPIQRDRDAHSVRDPVALDCGIQLRGSIDLVEKRGKSLRITDHKTGKVWVDPGEVIAGGESLQPVLYALAAEKLLPDAAVESGRLYYCTAAGGFADREVALDTAARESVELVSRVIDDALSTPFLAAAPGKDACRFCDYRRVCGPYEELRTARKQHGGEKLSGLAKLREAL